MNNTNKKLISVIIPCYNRGDFLRIALKSIRRQKYKNIEIIIVDDNSPDPIIKKLAGEFNCLYIRNSVNFGAQKSRNIGIYAASGNYIAFLDSDDIWCDNNKLERQIEILLDRPDIAIVFTRLKYIDKKGKEVELKKLENKSNFIIEDFKQTILEKDIIGTYSSVMVRRADLITVGMCNEILPARQDWDLWIKMSQLGKACRVGSVSIQYRVHDEQISSNPVKKVEGFISLLEAHRNEFGGIVKLRYLFIHFCKILLAIFLYNLSPNYIKRLLHLHLLICALAFFSSFFLYITTKFPLIGRLVINRLNKTYLYKGLAEKSTFSRMNSCNQ